MRLRPVAADHYPFGGGSAGNRLGGRVRPSTGRVDTCPAGSTLTIIRSAARCRTAESALWLSSAQPCIVQLATRRRAAGVVRRHGNPLPPRRASSAITMTSATARIASSTHTHAGVSLTRAGLEVVVAGRQDNLPGRRLLDSRRRDDRRRLRSRPSSSSRPWSYPRPGRSRRLQWRARSRRPDRRRALRAAAASSRDEDTP